MERDVTPCCANSAFTSPVLELTQSLKNLSTTSTRETPRRRLSLSSVTPSPSARPSVGSCGTSVGMDSSGSETDNSPYLHEKLLSRKKSSAKTLDIFPVVKDYRNQHAPALSLCAKSRGSLGSLAEGRESHAGEQQTKQNLFRRRFEEQPQSVVSMSRTRNEGVLSDGTNKPHPHSPCDRSLLTSHFLRSDFHSQHDICKLATKDCIGAAYTHPLGSKGSGTSESNTNRGCKYDIVSSFCTSSPSTCSRAGVMQKTKCATKRRASPLDKDIENISPASTSNRAPTVGFGNAGGRCRSPVSKKRCSVETDLADGGRNDSTAGSDKVQTDNYTSLMSPSSQRYHGCSSQVLANATIKSALSRSDDRLHEMIGDFTSSYCLPLVENEKHRDLKAISCHTLAQVLCSELGRTVKKCVIVDCRYPYEYEGGHIQNSLNVYTKDDIFSRFILSSEFYLQTESSGRQILVFHCEFSSERGPRLMHFLRNKDREAHRDSYPVLYYPEMYLLDGGYKSFFESYPELCEPPCYKPMLHNDHADDLRHFRAKSKSSSLADRESQARSKAGHKDSVKTRQRYCRRLT